jgi:hypothetical protein
MRGLTAARKLPVMSTHDPFDDDADQKVNWANWGLPTPHAYDDPRRQLRLVESETTLRQPVAPLIGWEVPNDWDHDDWGVSRTLH